MAANASCRSGPVIPKLLYQKRKQGGEVMKFKILLILNLILVCMALAASQAWAAEGGGITLNQGLIAIGMGLAVGLSALGTGLAQARIGAAGLGSAVEKPESLGLALIFLLLPETLVIFGLVIAFILLGKL
jgi:V/A-type H+-transporting ATPase subunit K